MHFLATGTKCNESNNYTKLVVIEVGEQKLPKVDGNCITRDTPWKKTAILLLPITVPKECTHSINNLENSLISAFVAFNLSSVSSALNLRNVRENRV